MFDRSDLADLNALVSDMNRNKLPSGLRKAKTEKEALVGACKEKMHYQCLCLLNALDMEQVFYFQCRH